MMIFFLIPLCCSDIRNMVPVNYALLAGFTVCESVGFAAVTAGLTPESVILSFGVLGLTFMGMWVAAMVAKDSLKMLVFLLVGLLVTACLQLIALITIFCIGYLSSGMIILYGFLGAIGAGIYVVIDLIYIMVPGAMSKDDYILGALMLYIDLLRMLLYILVILGKRK